MAYELNERVPLVTVQAASFAFAYKLAKDLGMRMTLQSKIKIGFEA
ncbi:uncharacterized protein G2W53_006893 [Senna tora]|uniref:Uncharacterized protein n=1 Tax=Senna tora TaxID=362788 RepID=A0A835CEF9_9FABA|nr:uncharacterized protein G2W53_006893 [Senna tora]